RGGNLASPATVAWAPLVATSAVAPAKGGKLTFPPGATSQTFKLTATADKLVDGPQAVVLGLQPGAPAVTGNQATTTLTIQDTDLGGTIQLAGDSFTVIEGSIANITVVRTGGQGGNVSVRYTIVDGSAVAKVDYIPPPIDTLTFGPGEMKKTISVKTNA